MSVMREVGWLNQSKVLFVFLRRWLIGLTTLRGLMTTVASTSRKTRKDKYISPSDGDDGDRATSTRRRSMNDVGNGVCGVCDVTRKRRSHPTSRFCRRFFGSLLGCLRRGAPESSERTSASADLTPYCVHSQKTTQKNC
ncbi:uncharacterized protein LOC144587067 [Pogona vitticeps]